MPTDAQASLKEIERKLRQAFGEDLREVVEKPVAFGLLSLEAIIVMDDTGGQLDRSEEIITGLSGVGSVETVSVDLL